MDLRGQTLVRVLGNEWFADFVNWCRVAQLHGLKTEEVFVLSRTKQRYFEVATYICLQAGIKKCVPIHYREHVNGSIRHMPGKG